MKTFFDMFAPIGVQDSNGFHLCVPHLPPPISTVESAGNLLSNGLNTPVGVRRAGWPLMASIRRFFFGAALNRRGHRMGVLLGLIPNATEFMNAHGHYFCDRCDDVAFGVRCQGCNHDARFVHDQPVEIGSTDRKREPHRLTVERAAVLFRQLHKQLAG